MERQKHKYWHSADTQPQQDYFINIVGNMECTYYGQSCVIVPVDVVKCDACNKLKTELKSCSLEFKVAALSFHI